jgi:hypothetical protein
MTCPECGMEMIPSPLDPTFLIHTESTDCAPQPWPRVPTEDCFGIEDENEDDTPMPASLQRALIENPHLMPVERDEVEEGRRERRDFYRNRDY